MNEEKADICLNWAGQLSVLCVVLFREIWHEEDLLPRVLSL
jgi:hypothetical protein